jgi:gas vesicle protein
MSERDEDMLFLAGLFFGAVVGAAAAVLLTPQSGPDMREQVAERGIELRNRAEDAVQRAQEVANDALAKVQTAAQELIRQQPGDDLVNNGGGI